MGGELSKPDPSSTLEVIGPSYSRTGTSSMQVALEKLLDGPTYHGGTHIWTGFDAGRNKLWAEAVLARDEGDKEKTLKLVRQAVSGYRAAIDVPIYIFLPELLELFPEAKVVLNTRDGQKWRASMGNILAFKRQANDLLIEAGNKPTKDTGNGELEMMDYGPDLLEYFNNKVIQIVPKERLLIMHVNEGWEPLAKFLGKPVPDEPFPHVNESAAMEACANMLFWRFTFNWVKLISTVTGVVGDSAYLGWRLWNRRY